MNRWNVISNIVKRGKYKSGVEIGVAYGRNIFNVLDACPDLNMIAVDIWKPVENVSDSGPKGLYGYPKVPHSANEIKVRAGAVKYGDRLTILKQESTEAAKRFDDGCFDFVFIDACHAQKEVELDINAWRDKVRDGGVIMGHDIHFQSVADAVINTLGEYETLPDNCWCVYA